MKTNGTTQRILILALALFASTTLPMFAQGLSSSGSPKFPGMVLIPTGVYHPLFKFKTDAAEVPVKAFYLDAVPVSNGDFLEFVRANPRWQRSQVKRLFADESYLKDWAGDLDPGNDAPANAPVTVRLLVRREGLCAMERQTACQPLPNGNTPRPPAPRGPTGKTTHNSKPKSCNGIPRPRRRAAARRVRAAANFFGVRDLHGLVWEWVADFNSAMISDDSRGDGVLERRFFCGAGSQGAQDVDDYPAFMRYAFRSSLKADYCIHDLGFRCAKDL